MKEATDLVAEYTGESCELDDDRRLWLKGHNLIEHFNAWIKVFTDPSGEPAVPSDLMSAIENQKLCPELAKAAPALYYCSLMSKNGPFKEKPPQQVVVHVVTGVLGVHVVHGVQVVQKDIEPQDAQVVQVVQGVVGVLGVFVVPDVIDVVGCSPASGLDPK
jgi:hypothetical protein